MRLEQNCGCLSAVVKLLSSLWTAGCLDVASACLASARCCSEIMRACILEELKFSHACPDMTFISTLFLPTFFLFFQPRSTYILGVFWDSRVQRDGVGVHLWATPDASVSTCVATGKTLCCDGERNGLDNAWPRAVAPDGVCVCVCNELGLPDFAAFSCNLFTSSAFAGQCIAGSSEEFTHFNEASHT